MYDHVIIDCVSMHIDEIMLESFHRSEKIFVVMDLSIPAIRNAVRLGKIMQQFGVDNSKIYYVVNRFTKSSSDTLETAEKNLGKKIFWLFPNDFEDIVSSINEGVPLVQLHPHNVFSKNIVQFVEKIQGKTRDTNYRGARGAFGRAI
jgi:pilus assembly protein CpaE